MKNLFITLSFLAVSFGFSFVAKAQSINQVFATQQTEETIQLKADSTVIHDKFYAVCHITQFSSLLQELNSYKTVNNEQISLVAKEHNSYVLTRSFSYYDNKYIINQHFSIQLKAN